jgi:regulator of telomere elongation helicase 1
VRLSSTKAFVPTKTDILLDFLQTGWDDTPSTGGSRGACKRRVLSFWCFSPGFALRNIMDQKIHSLILTSCLFKIFCFFYFNFLVFLLGGTLSPLSAFVSELKIPFEIQLENPHIITRSQVDILGETGGSCFSYTFLKVWAGVLTHGPSGQILNSSFQHRDTDSYKRDLGNTLGFELRFYTQFFH